jgi:hypothetical protein
LSVRLEALEAMALVAARLIPVVVVVAAAVA